LEVVRAQVQDTLIGRWYDGGMFKLFKKRKETDLTQVVERQLQKNREAIESLREYDAGRKDISTRTAEERLPGIRIAA
jgi:hypothetical protein